MIKQWHLTLILTMTATMSIFLSACTTDTSQSAQSTKSTSEAASSCVASRIIVAGDSTLQPLISVVAKSYSTKCPGASITITANSSKQSLADVETGAIQVGNSDIFANKTTQANLVDHQVAVAVFALIVNPKVSGVTTLSTSQLKEIYSGGITNWKQVGGPNLPIVLVSHPRSSGIRTTFENYILHTPEAISGPSNLIADSPESVIRNVKQTDGTIGYTVLGPAKSSGLTILSINNNAPTANLVERNSYKFWAFEHMYTKDQASGLARAFIDYMTSDSAKATIASMQFLAIADMSPLAVASHQQH